MTGYDRLDLLALIRQGESEYIEFKESLGELKEILQTVVAFANKNGGKIIVGVRDNGDVIGVTIGKGTIENLVNSIVDAVEPPIYPSITVESISGKKIVVIDVPSGTNKPYFYKGRAYIRIGRTNKILSPSELRDLISKTITSEPWDSRDAAKLDELEIDKETITFFIEEAIRSRRAPIDTNIRPEELLRKLDLIRNGNVTSAGVLLFSTYPQKYFPWAVIKAGRFKDEFTIIDEAEINGNLFRQVEEALRFVLRNIGKTFRINPKTWRREDIWEYPIKAVREAIINAVIHRDYSIYSPIYIKIYDDKLTIINPGELIEPLTIDDLAREHPSILRNPRIANVFYIAGYIERWGVGTLKMIEECRKQGLPPPEFSVQRKIFRVEIRKTKELSQKELEALKYIREKKIVKRKDIQQYLKVSERTARRILSKLENLGLIIRHGKGSKIYYTPKEET